MILRYVDAKILPGYAAVDRGRIFGYSFFVYEGSKGVIGDLYVTNGARLPDAQPVESATADTCHRDSAAIARNPSRRSAVVGPRSQCSFAPVSRDWISAPSAAVHGAALEERRRQDRLHCTREVEMRPWTEAIISPRPPSSPPSIAAMSMRRSTTSTARSADLYVS